MSDEFVFKRPDETTSEARERLRRGEDTRTISRDDDDNGRRSRRSRRRRRRRDRDEEQSGPSPSEVLEERFEELGERRRGLLDARGSVDISDLSEFRDVTEQRRQIQNELDKIESGDGEVVIRSPGESLESATRDAASRRARRLSDLTSRSVEVTKDVPRRRQSEQSDRGVDLQNLLLETQRQRSEEEQRREVIRRALLAESRRRSRPADVREAEGPGPLFDGDIPFLTPLSRVARRPLDRFFETEQEREERVLTQSDIPGLESASTRAAEFVESVGQRADTSLVRGENRVGLGLAREGLDIATGIGFVAAQPGTVASAAGRRVQEAAESGDALDIVPRPQNQALARRRLPFALGAEVATGFVPVSGFSRGRRLTRFGDDVGSVRSGDLTSFEPAVVDVRTGQTTLQRIDDVDDIAVTERGVGGATRVDEPQSFLVDEETGRVTGLSRRGPLGEELASQQPSRFRESAVDEEFVVGRDESVEQLTGSLDRSQVSGDVVNPASVQQRLLDEPTSQQRLGSDETFVLENVNTGRIQTVRGDRVGSLLESGRFTIVNRNPGVAERTRIRQARNQQRTTQGSGFQTDLTSLRNNQRQPSRSIVRNVDDADFGLGLGKRAQAQLAPTRSRFDLDTSTDVNIGRRSTRLSRRRRSVFPEPDSEGLSRQLDRLATRRLTRTRFSPIGFSLLDSDTRQSLDSLQSQDGLQGLSDMTGLREELSFDTVQSQRIGSLQRQAQRQGQEFDSLLRQDSRGSQRRLSRGSITRPTTRQSRGRSSGRGRPRGRGRSGFGIPSISRKDSDGKPSRVDVFVKRKGRFEKVNTGGSLSFDEGKSLGAKVVSNTPARTFKVEPSTSMRRGEFRGDTGFFSENRDRFRESKSEPGALVEKSEFAIDSPGELRGITFKGLDSLRTKNTR